MSSETTNELSADEWARFDAVVKAVAEHHDLWHHGPLLKRVAKATASLRPAPALSPSRATPTCAKCGAEKRWVGDALYTCPRCGAFNLNPAPSRATGEPTRAPHCCPVCNGAGHVSRPPHIAGDVPEWTDSGVHTYPCRACDGSGVVWNAAPTRAGTGETPLSDERLAEIARLVSADKVITASPLAHELLAEVERTRADAVLGAALREAVKELQESDCRTLAISPEGRAHQFRAIDLVWRDTNATRVLSALLRDAEEETSNG